MPLYRVWPPPLGCEGGVRTISKMVIVWLEGTAPGDEIVRVALYAPALKPLIAAPTTRGCTPVPDAEDRVTQAALGVAVQFPRVPPPEFERISDWLVGLFDPAIALKSRFVGAVPTPGVEGGATVNETFTICCEGEAPGALTVNDPE